MLFIVVESYAIGVCTLQNWRPGAVNLQFKAMTSHKCVSKVGHRDCYWDDSVWLNILSLDNTASQQYLALTIVRHIYHLHNQINRWLR
jgi:hypothetical protein